MVDLRISEKQKPGIFRFHSLKVDLRTYDKAEVLKCFSQLGFYVTSTTSIIEGDEFLFVQDNGRVFSCENAISSDGYEWVTLDHLKDMVILNRNDVNDATHVMPDDGDKFVKLSDGWRYWTDDGMDAYGQYAFAWQKNGNSDEYLEANLRPIQKTKTSNPDFLEPENTLAIELNNFKIVDGIEAISAVRDGFNVEYETDEGAWDQFDLETGFKVGCLLGQPNRHNKVVRFRIVPKTLKIVGTDGNVYEFPTPIQHYPPEGTTCFIASLSDPGARLPQQTTFSGNDITKMWVDHRRLHLTAEDALAHIEAEVRALGGKF